MSTTPPPPPGSEGGFPPPPPSGPWASDSLPQYRTATANVVAQPPSIRTAVRLMWVGAATAVVTALSPLVQSDTIRDRLRDKSPELTNSEVDSMMAVNVAFAIVIGALAVALWLWMAYANGQGRRWARVVATVLGSLGILFGLIGLALRSATAISRVLNVVQVALAITILVLLWQSASSAYYEARSRTY